MASVCIRRIASLLILLVAGCDKPATQTSNLPTVPMNIGSRQYTLEVAKDDYSREKGLMERDSMPADHGMIFVFAADTSEGFWMHHTRIPLDILFVDSAGSVVSVKHMKAYDEHTTTSDGPYRYAIELNAGTADDCGVKSGDKLTIPPDAAHSDK